MPDVPPLEGDAVHTWILRIPEDDADAIAKDSKAEFLLAEHVLNFDEKKRAAAFHYEADRARFTRCRSALRHLIAAYLGIDSSEAEFGEGPFGKPWLRHPEHALQFNLSHTRGLGVISISRTAETGIDVESSTRPVRDRDLIPRCFTEREQRDIAADEGAWQETFFRYWTAKESLMKATGLGLSLDPRKIEVTLPASSGQLGSFATSSRRLRAEAWTLHEFADIPPFKIALATPTGIDRAKITVRELAR